MIFFTLPLKTFLTFANFPNHACHKWAGIDITLQTIKPIFMEINSNPNFPNTLILTFSDLYSVGRWYLRFLLPNLDGTILEDSPRFCTHKRNKQEKPA